jgi:hypothetical protein
MTGWKSVGETARNWILAGTAVLAFAGWLIALGASSNGDLRGRVGVAEANIQSATASAQSNREAIDALTLTVNRTWCVVRAQAIGGDPKRQCLFGEEGGR